MFAEFNHRHLQVPLVGAGFQGVLPNALLEGVAKTPETDLKNEN
jgi:hypothetical protein